MIGRATSRWLLGRGAVRAPGDPDLHFDPEKGRTMYSVPNLAFCAWGSLSLIGRATSRWLLSRGAIRAPGDPDLHFDTEKGCTMSSVPGSGVLCLGVTQFDWACDQQMVAGQGRGARAGGPRPAF